MTNEEAISVIENEIQIDVRLCTDKQVDKFQTALYMAISALRAEPTGKALTLEQLREMDGQPAWCEEQKEWGIIHIDPDGMWANIPFLRGVYCDLDAKHNGLTLYAFPPAHIDLVAWKPCRETCRNTCMSCDPNADELFGDADYCEDCHHYSKWESSVHKYCELCGRPKTPEALAELEKRMGVR